jgi:hypothetical protein
MIANRITVKVSDNIVISFWRDLRKRTIHAAIEVGHPNARPNQSFFFTFSLSFMKIQFALTRLLVIEKRDSKRQKQKLARSHNSLRGVGHISEMKKENNLFTILFILFLYGYCTKLDFV